MAVEKVYKCDLCGEHVARDALRRLSVRTLDDRPEDGDNVDVGPECRGQPVGYVIDHGTELRREIVDGT